MVLSLKEYRYQIDGVMKNKIPNKKTDILMPWRLVQSRKTEHCFDYVYEVPSGYSIIDLEKQIDAFYAATGCIVELEDHAGQVVMSVFPKDFPKEIPFSTVEPLLTNGKVLLGLNRRMQPIYHSFQVNPFVLIGGLPGYGKTDLLRFTMYQMLLMGYEIRVVDMKGFSFMPFAKIPGFRIARDLQSAMELLEETAKELLDREEQVYTHPNHRKLIETFKPICVIVDEAVHLSPTLVSGDRRDPTSAKYLAIRCVEHCAKIATKGRETRVSLIYCTQRPDAEVVNGQIKGVMDTAICFRTRSSSNSEIILDRTGAEKLPMKVPGRMIYGGMDDVIIQVPFVGKDDKWEELLTPFYWKEGKENAHREFSDKKPVETSDYGDVEDITDLQDRTANATPSGAQGESTKTGFRDIKGTGKKRSFGGESGTQSDIGGVESVPSESAGTEANGDHETTDTFEYY